MKILHTSDWHLGQTFYDYDRTEEHKHFFEQLKKIVREEKPDLLLVSGDLFHTSAPSIAAQELYNESLLGFRDESLAFGGMHIILIAGNHDSSSKLDVDGLLWKYFNTDVVGTIPRDNDESLDNTSFYDSVFAKHIIPVRKRRESEILGYVVAVPHCYPQNFPNINPEDGKQERMKRFIGVLLEKVDDINIEGLPVILTAHTLVTGSNIKGHDALIIGGLDNSDIGTFGSGWDYLALGHIHFPQEIKGSNGKARYSGSPFAMNFEEDYDHFVNIVEIEKRGDMPQVRQIPIKPLYEMVTLSAKELPEEKNSCMDLLRVLEEYPAHKKAYIRLEVLETGELPSDYIQRVKTALKGKKARYCLIKQELPDNPAEGEGLSLTAAQVGALSPREMAEIIAPDLFGEAEEGYAKLFEQAVTNVSNQMR
ncbi:MAG TPA: exonuclease SbcCD subunit D [Bacteroidales bacterium]|nr:exonuclease SbcCD subunit D [Bacteroidales bacterium]